MENLKVKTPVRDAQSVQSTHLMSVKGSEKPLKRKSQVCESFSGSDELAPEKLMENPSTRRRSLFSSTTAFGREAAQLLLAADLDDTSPSLVESTSQRFDDVQIKVDVSDEAVAILSESAIVEVQLGSARFGMRVGLDWTCLDLKRRLMVAHSSFITSPSMTLVVQRGPQDTPKTFCLEKNAVPSYYRVVGDAEHISAFDVIRVSPAM
jgi:hypothetical protein